eukprot:m.50891 g.50891  ORF g.50891 m.50891 type:complete len:384 (+) comp10692_c0_seq2:1700-2851(+)
MSLLTVPIVAYRISLSARQAITFPGRMPLLNAGLPGLTLVTVIPGTSPLIFNWMPIAMFGARIAISRTRMETVFFGFFAVSSCVRLLTFAADTELIATFPVSLRVSTPSSLVIGSSPLSSFVLPSRGGEYEALVLSFRCPNKKVFKSTASAFSPSKFALTFILADVLSTGYGAGGPAAFWAISFSTFSAATIFLVLFGDTPTRSLPFFSFSNSSSKSIFAGPSSSARVPAIVSPSKSSTSSFLLACLASVVLLDGGVIQLSAFCLSIFKRFSKNAIFREATPSASMAFDNLSDRFDSVIISSHTCLSRLTPRSISVANSPRKFLIIASRASTSLCARCNIVATSTDDMLPRVGVKVFSARLSDASATARAMVSLPTLTAKRSR